MDTRTQLKIKAYLDYLFQSIGALALMVWKALNIVATGRLLATVV